MTHTFTVFKGSESGAIKKSTTTKGELTNDEVLVKVTASGVCGTDEHFHRADMVLGHEGVGVVEKLGPNTKSLKVGDRVGWGYQHGACGLCDHCLSGWETFCEKRCMYGFHDLDQGSMAHKAVWPEAFLIKIPDSITDEVAAPLMCGGITVFAALNDHGARPTHRVGVIGIGGLGHLAIQFAAKMGCEVVVFSSTESKKQEAMDLGATEFVATKGATSLKEKVSRPIDQLLVTASFPVDWDLILPVMAPNATVYPLTVSDQNLTIPYNSILFHGLRIQGSLVGTRHVQNKMLRFAAHHKIESINMKFPMTEEGITEAMDKLEKGQIRYRAVLIPQEE